MSSINGYANTNVNYYTQRLGSRISQSANSGATAGVTNDKHGKAKNEDPLASLISAGTITKKQSHEIKKAMHEAIQASAVARHKVQSTTSTDGTTATDATTDATAAAGATATTATGTTTDIATKLKEIETTTLQKLVDAKTITAEQMTAISSAFETARASGQMPAGAPSGAPPPPGAKGPGGAPPPPPPPGGTESATGTSNSGTTLSKSELLEAMLGTDSDQDSDDATSSSTLSSKIGEVLDKLTSTGTITKEQKASIQTAFEEMIKNLAVMMNNSSDWYMKDGTASGNTTDTTMGTTTV